jgi:hypothetical protein
MARLIPTPGVIALLALLALVALGACEDLGQEDSDRVDARSTASWSFIPIRLALADDLTRCQRAGMLAAVAYWEGLTDVRLFQVETATFQDRTTGLRKLGTVVVVDEPTDNRESILHQAELTYVEGRKGEVLHSAEVRIRGCSPRAYAHELGHVLGFVEHAQGARALMRIEDVPSAWDVSEGEIESLHEALARVP